MLARLGWSSVPVCAAQEERPTLPAAKNKKEDHIYVWYQKTVTRRGGRMPRRVPLPSLLFQEVAL